MIYCTLYLANKCRPNLCQNGGTCKELYQSISQMNDTAVIRSYVACECELKYHGDFCQYRNACYINPCKNDGICSIFNNTDFQCSCKNSSIGKTCRLGKLIVG